MSLYVASMVMDTRLGNPALKFLLFKLADNAQDDGEGEPYYDLLCEQCDFEPEQLVDALKTLVKAQLLTLNHDPSFDECDVPFQLYPNHYQLNLELLGLDLRSNF